ncbi:MAG: SLC13 family permease [Candidatus Izemoplasmatales bacterium]|nr:SLC13 family permease [Candidatus Izemoplasmatales bacterium]
MKRIGAFFWKDKVFLIAFIVAIVSMFFIAPSIRYIEYINPKVLIIMFTLMIAVAGMYEANFFSFVAIHLVSHFFTIKYIAFVIVVATFFLGMLVTNDAVLLTLVPFTLFVTKQTKMQRHALFIVILQTIAANMGSALTPMGDPQNIYLYAFYDIPFMTFITTMLPITITGLILVSVTTLVFIPNTHCEPIMVKPIVDSKRMIIYTILFFNALLSVLRVYSIWIGLIVTIVITLLFCLRLVKKVDVHLLLTFTMFFIFTGNLSQITNIQSSIQGLLSSPTSVYFTGLFTSQFISNVPGAVLLSTFTPAPYSLALLQGVNVGAMGTIISSLASLITFKFVLKEFPKDGKLYLKTYSLLSIVFIIIITIVVFLFW